MKEVRESFRSTSQVLRGVQCTLAARNQRPTFGVTAIDTLATCLWSFALSSYRKMSDAPSTVIYVMPVRY